MNALAKINIETVPVEDVFVVGNRREVNEEAVGALVDSIRKIGLQTPITVRGDDHIIDPETGEEIEAYALVAGRHRLEACRRLGFARIPVVIMDGDAIEAELWEIAENLHRADLTALERDEQVARWIELSANKLAQIAPVSGGRGKQGGIRAAARELGIDRDDARRADKVASLSPDAKKVAVETGLDKNRSVLLAARVDDDDEQKAEKEVAYLRQEHARREAEKARKEAERLNRDTDRVISLTEAEQFANWLMERSDLSELPTIISWLEGTKPRDVIAAIRRAAA